MFSFFSTAPKSPPKGLKSNEDARLSSTSNSSSTLLLDNLASHSVEPDDKSSFQELPIPIPRPRPSPSSSSSSSSPSLSSTSSPSCQSTQSLSSSSLSLCSPQPTSTHSPGSASTGLFSSSASIPLSHVIIPTPTPSPVSDFTKFAEKRKNQAEKQNKTLRSILRSTAQRFGLRERISSSSSTSSLSPSTAITRSKGKNFLRLESFPLSYGDLYNSIGSMVPWGTDNGIEVTTPSSIDEGPLEDIQRQVNVIADQLNEMKTVDEMSAAVSSFYQSMMNRFADHPTFKEIVQVSADQLIDYTEIRLLSSTWNTIFNQILIENEDQDLQLQSQIRSLNWITADHLELDLDLTSPEICDLMDQAIGQIVEMGSKGIPLQKLECIVACSKALLQLLNLSREGEPVSADQFLPALVYTVIQANPPLLHSNIKLINQFSSPNRLSSGEASYYFTNLCCAVAFIEKLDGESLNLSEEEFRRYTNGYERPNNGYNDQSQLNNRLNEAYRRMSSNNNLIASLTPKQSALEMEINQLKETVRAQQESLLSQLQSITDSLVFASTIHNQALELREVIFRSRVKISPFHRALSTTE